MSRELATLTHLRSVMCDTVAELDCAADLARSIQLMTALVSMSARTQSLLCELTEHIDGRDGIIICEGSIVSELRQMWMAMSNYFAGGDAVLIRRVREATRHQAAQLERALAGKTLSNPARQLAGKMAVTARRASEATARIDWSRH